MKIISKKHTAKKKFHHQTLLAGVLTKKPLTSFLTNRDKQNDSKNIS